MKLLKLYDAGIEGIKEPIEVIATNLSMDAVLKIPQGWSCVVETAWVTLFLTPTFAFI